METSEKVTLRHLCILGILLKIQTPQGSVLLYFTRLLKYCWNFSNGLVLIQDNSIC